VLIFVLSGHKQSHKWFSIYISNFSSKIHHKFRKESLLDFFFLFRVSGQNSSSFYYQGRKWRLKGRSKDIGGAPATAEGAFFQSAVGTLKERTCSVLPLLYFLVPSECAVFVLYILTSVNLSCLKLK